MRILIKNLSSFGIYFLVFFMGPSKQRSQTTTDCFVLHSDRVMFISSDTPGLSNPQRIRGENQQKDMGVEGKGN